MKNKDLFENMGMIDAELIERSEKAAPKKKNYLKYAGIAACICLMAAASPIILSELQNSDPIVEDPISETVDNNGEENNYPSDPEGTELPPVPSPTPEPTPEPTPAPNPEPTPEPDPEYPPAPNPSPDPVYPPIPDRGEPPEDDENPSTDPSPNQEPDPVAPEPPPEEIQSQTVYFNSYSTIYPSAVPALGSFREDLTEAEISAIIPGAYAPNTTGFGTFSKEGKLLYTNAFINYYEDVIMTVEMRTFDLFSLYGLDDPKFTDLNGVEFFICQDIFDDSVALMAKAEINGVHIIFASSDTAENEALLKYNFIAVLSEFARKADTVPDLSPVKADVIPEFIMEDITLEEGLKTEEFGLLLPENLPEGTEYVNVSRYKDYASDKMTCVWDGNGKQLIWEIFLTERETEYVDFRDLTIETIKENGTYSDEAGDEGLRIDIRVRFDHRVVEISSKGLSAEYIYGELARIAENFSN